jgi:predicted RNase H-like HicB family nuclease
MRKFSFLGVFEPGDYDSYSVYFPDLPGCISCGDNFEEAQRNAVEALNLHIYGMEKDGDPIPAPSKVPAIDPETADGYLVSPITIYPDMFRINKDNRAVKTNTTIPAWLKEMAEAKGINYSQVLQTALMEMLGVAEDRITYGGNLR